MSIPSSGEEDRIGAAITWIIYKSFKDDVPNTFKDVFYKDNNVSVLRPHVVCALTSSELYASACAHLFKSTKDAWMSHSVILSNLSRRGFPVVDAISGKDITAVVLQMDSPFCIESHIALIYSIMSSFTTEMAPSNLVTNALRTLGRDQTSVSHLSSVESLQRWVGAITKIVITRLLRKRLQQVEISVEEVDAVMKRLSLGTRLACLLYHYCPQYVAEKDIALSGLHLSANEELSNARLVVSVCAQSSSHRLFFLPSPESLVHKAGHLQINITVMVAEMFHWFIGGSMSSITSLMQSHQQTTNQLQASLAFNVTNNEMQLINASGGAPQLLNQPPGMPSSFRLGPESPEEEKHLEIASDIFPPLQQDSDHERDSMEEDEIEEDEIEEDDEFDADDKPQPSSARSTNTAATYLIQQQTSDPLQSARSTTTFLLNEPFEVLAAHQPIPSARSDTSGTTFLLHDPSEGLQRPVQDQSQLNSLFLSSTPPINSQLNQPPVLNPSNDQSADLSQTSFHLQEHGSNLPQTSFKLQDTSSNLPQTAFKLQDTGSNLPQTAFKLQDIGSNPPQTFKLDDMASNQFAGDRIDPSSISKPFVLNSEPSQSSQDLQLHKMMASSFAPAAPTSSGFTLHGDSADSISNPSGILSIDSQGPDSLTSLFLPSSSNPSFLPPQSDPRCSISPDDIEEDNDISDEDSIHDNNNEKPGLTKAIESDHDKDSIGSSPSTHDLKDAMDEAEERREVSDELDFISQDNDAVSVNTKDISHDRDSIGSQTSEFDEKDKSLDVSAKEIELSENLPVQSSDHDIDSIGSEKSHGDMESDYDLENKENIAVLSTDENGEMNESMSPLDSSMQNEEGRETEDEVEDLGNRRGSSNLSLSDRDSEKEFRGVDNAMVTDLTPEAEQRILSQDAGDPHQTDQESITHDNASDSERSVASTVDLPATKFPPSSSIIPLSPPHTEFSLAKALPEIPPFAKPQKTLAQMRATSASVPKPCNVQSGDSESDMKLSLKEEFERRKREKANPSLVKNGGVKKSASFGPLPNQTTWKATVEEQQDRIEKRRRRNLSVDTSKERRDKSEGGSREDDERRREMSRLSDMRIRLEQRKRQIEKEKERLLQKAVKHRDSANKAAFLHLINKQGSKKERKSPRSTTGTSSSSRSSRSSDDDGNASSASRKSTDTRPTPPSTLVRRGSFDLGPSPDPIATPTNEIVSRPEIAFNVTESGSRGSKLPTLEVLRSDMRPACVASPTDSTVSSVASLPWDTQSSISTHPRPPLSATEYNHSLDRLNHSLSDLQAEIMRLSLQQDQINRTLEGPHVAQGHPQPPSSPSPLTRATWSQRPIVTQISSFPPQQQNQPYFVHPDPASQHQQPYPGHPQSRQYPPPQYYQQHPATSVPDPHFPYPVHQQQFQQYPPANFPTSSTNAYNLSQQYPLYPDTNNSALTNLPQFNQPPTSKPGQSWQPPSVVSKATGNPSTLVPSRPVSVVAPSPSTTGLDELSRRDTGVTEDSEEDEDMSPTTPLSMATVHPTSSVAMTPVSPPEDIDEDDYDDEFPVQRGPAVLSTSSLSRRRRPPNSVVSTHRYRTTSGGSSSNDETTTTVTQITSRSRASSDCNVDSRSYRPSRRSNQRSSQDDDDDTDDFADTPGVSSAETTPRLPSSAKRQSGGTFFVAFGDEGAPPGSPLGGRSRVLGGAPGSLRACTLPRERRKKHTVVVESHEETWIEREDGETMAVCMVPGVDEEEEEEVRRRRAIFMEQQERREKERERLKLKLERERSLKRETQRMEQEARDEKKAMEKQKKEAILQAYLKEKDEGQSPVIMRRGPSRSDSLSRRVKSVTVKESKGPPQRSNSTVGGSRKKPLSASTSSVTGEVEKGGSLRRPINKGIRGGTGSISVSSINLASTTPQRQSISAKFSSSQDLASPTHQSYQHTNTTTDYTGPKLFVKPKLKSNRSVIHNAISHCCLAGTVNEPVKRNTLKELANTDGSHFMILFRDARCQYRALYVFNLDTEELSLIFGNGPRKINHDMVSKFFKYNSGGKHFTEIASTKHLSAVVDAVAIHSHLWKNQTSQASLQNQMTPAALASARLKRIL